MIMMKIVTFTQIAVLTIVCHCPLCKYCATEMQLVEVLIYLSLIAQWAVKISLTGEGCELFFHKVNMQ